MGKAVVEMIVLTDVGFLQRLCLSVPFEHSEASDDVYLAIVFNEAIVVAFNRFVAFLGQYLVELAVVAGASEHLSVDVAHPEASV